MGTYKSDWMNISITITSHIIIHLHCHFSSSHYAPHYIDIPAFLLKLSQRWAVIPLNNIKIWQFLFYWDSIDFPLSRYEDKQHRSY